MDAKIFRVNYKSDFILTLTSDAGWMTPFCIKFWTGSPQLAYYASYDGETFTHCTYDPAEPTKITVQFDDHHLPIGNLKYQVAYHFTVADFPENTEDEVTNQANVTTVIDGDTYQVMLDLNGETAPEIQFALPAYANELQRIQNEQTRIAQEQQRIANEQTRINHEAARVSEFNGIVNTANADHQRANEDHSRAQTDHQNALADRSQAASDHSRAQSDHNTATSDHSQANSDYIRAQSDHNTALSDHQTALSDHTQANTDHTRAESDHTRATADSSTAAADHRTASTDHTQANTDHARAESDHQRVETDLAEVEEFSNSLGAYDISAANATGSTLATYPDLATALGPNGSNIPEAIRKGGMSVKFVLSSNYTYVQYRLMSNQWSTTISDWQGVDEEPTAGSENLVKSGGVEESFWVGGESTVIDLSDFNRIPYVIDVSTNKWLYFYGYAGIIVPIIGGKRYTIKATQDTRYALLANYRYLDYQDVSYATGCAYEILYANKEIEFLAPLDAHGLYVVTNKPNGVVEVTLTKDSKHDIRKIDTTPVIASDNLITSGGVAEPLREVENKLRGIKNIETKDATSNTSGYIVLTDGTLFGVEGAAYRKINVDNVLHVRFLGIVQESGNEGKAGIAFYDETAAPTDTSNIGFISGFGYEVGTLPTKSLKEYTVLVPQGAKYLYILSKLTNADIPTFNDDFYCYLESGELVASEKSLNAFQASVDAKLKDITPIENKDYTSDVNGYVIFADGEHAGKLYAMSEAAYRKVNVEGIDKVRLLGIEQEAGNSGVVGFAFYNSDANPTTSVNTGFISGVPFDIGTGNAKTEKEYIVDVPEGAVYLYVMSKFVSADVPNFNDDFYCYLINYGTAASTEYVDENINYLKDGIIKTIYDDIATINTGSSATDDYPSGYQESKNRIRVLVNVKKGQFVSANMSLDYVGCALQVYITRKTAISGGINSNVKQNITDVDFVRSVKDVEIVSDGILSISLKKLDDSYFTLEEYNACIDALHFSVTDYGITNLAVKQKNKTLLFIGTLVQKAVESTKLSDGVDNTRVSMQSEVCLPHQNIALNIKIKKGYYFGIRYGENRDTLSVVKEWYGDGAWLNIPSGYLHYRCYFSKGDNHTDVVTVNEIKELISNGEIEISYEGDCDVLQSNIESEKYIKSVLRYFFSVAEAGTATNAMKLNRRTPNIPTFGHTSDIHGDVVRYNRFLDYCDYIGVDAALISGDFVANMPSQACQYINDIADEHKTMVLPCTGNHDCYGLATAQEQREQIVGYLMDKNNVVTNTLETYPTYFYKDIVDNKIRIISLNTFEGSRSGHQCNFTQQQCEWFINALATTPSDYGVIVMFHSPEGKPNIESGYDSFYQDKYAYGLYYQVGITGNPISKIIDAFISKVSATVSYTSQSVAITVTPDFTNVNSGVEFIAYVTGHQHIDWIGTVNGTTNRQLMLNVTCTAIYFPINDPYGANLSDLSRDGIGSTQDSFNIYGIDRINKTVRVVRIGSNINFEGKERKFMIIPYAD